MVESRDHMVSELELAHIGSMEPLEVTLVHAIESLLHHVGIPMQ